MSAEVDLDGGRLAAVVDDGLSLLVGPTDRATRWGSFPMIPWCGRLPNGRLRFDGERYDFPITSPPHANHGLLHTTDWDVVGDASDTELTISAPFPEAWPFGGHAVQRFELTPASLTITVEVHAGDRPMPAMAGWHPWFNRRLERGGNAKLDVMAESAYAVGTDMIPTGELTAVPPQPWNDCFVDLVLPPVIEWPNALTLSIESSFDHWVVFTIFLLRPPKGRFPVTIPCPQIGVCTVVNKVLDHFQMSIKGGIEQRRKFPLLATCFQVNFLFSQQQFGNL